MIHRMPKRLAVACLALVVAAAVAGPGYCGEPLDSDPSAVASDASGSDVDDALARAKQAYADGDVAGAVGIWNELALKGNGDAQFALGVVYDLGKGVTRDVQEAAKWYRLAGAQKNMKAQVSLTSLYAASIVDGMISGTESLLHCQHVDASELSWLVGVFPKRQKMLWVKYAADETLLEQSVTVVELPDVDYYAIPLDGRLAPDVPFSTKDIGADYLPGERSELTLTVSLLISINRYRDYAQYDIDRMTGVGKSFGEGEIQCERADAAVARSQATDFVIKSFSRLVTTVDAFSARKAEVLAQRKF